MEISQLISLVGGLALLPAIFAAGYFGEQSRLAELELAVVGGAL